jgi:hypothetical protein
MGAERLARWSLPDQIDAGKGATNNNVPNERDGGSPCPGRPNKPHRKANANATNRRAAMPTNDGYELVDTVLAKDFFLVIQ